MLLVGLPAGVLADRGDRLVLLRAANTAMALALTALGTLTTLGHVTIGAILAITFFVGSARALQQVTQQTHTHDLVGPARLTEALGALGIAMRIGGLTGSLLAGRLIASRGPGTAYLAAATACLVGTLVLPRRSTHHASPPSAATSIWEGVSGFIRAARAERRLPMLMAMTAAGEVFGFSHQAVLPSLARDVLHTGPEGLGALNAARAVGGIVGLAAVSLRGTASTGPRFLAVLIVYGASLIALGASPHVTGLVGVLLVLTVVNVAGALADLFAQSLLQLSVSNALRGRAGGAWVLAIGLAPLGQLQIGALASLFGVSLALGTSGLALVLLVAGTAVLFPRVTRVGL